MDINCHIPAIDTRIFLCRKWWIEPGFIASQTSYLYDSRIECHYIDSFLSNFVRGVESNMQSLLTKIKKSNSATI